MIHPNIVTQAVIKQFHPQSVDVDIYLHPPTAAPSASNADKSSETNERAGWLLYQPLYSSSVHFLVSWCFEPSQTLRILSRLKTNFYPSLSYPAPQSYFKKDNHNCSAASGQILNFRLIGVSITGFIVVLFVFHSPHSPKIQHSLR